MKVGEEKVEVPQTPPVQPETMKSKADPEENETESHDQNTDDDDANKNDEDSQAKLPAEESENGDGK